MNELARKDLLICLGIWLVLEIISFGILPALGIQIPGLYQTWFSLSIPLGIGGAALLASSPQLQDLAMTRPSRLTRLLAPIASWLGLLGVGYPILVISLAITSSIFTKI